MSYTYEKQEHNMALFTVTVEDDIFARALDGAYKRQKNRISLPGFRKGKVSRQVVEKMFGKDFFYPDAANIAIPEAWEKVYDDCGEEIVSTPEIEVTQLEAGKPVIFTALAALNPEAKLGKYKGVEIEKIDLAVSDAEVDAAVDAEREEQARMVAVERAVKDGDQVILDFDGSIDGVAFDGGKGENHPLTVGSNSFIPGFEEQLIGKKADEEFDVNVTFPEDYHAEELAGKPAVFKCLIHEVKERQLPELDEDFADDAGFDSVEEYKADVKEKLENKKKEEAKAKKEDAVVEKIVSEAEMDIPEAMIKTEVNRAIENQDQMMRMQGLTLDQYFMFSGTSREQMIEQTTPEVEKAVRGRLVLEAVARAEGFDATDEEIDKEIEDTAKNYGMGKDEFKDMMGEHELKIVKKDVLIKKALDFVVENAKEK